MVYKKSQKYTYTNITTKKIQKRMSWGCKTQSKMNQNIQWNNDKQGFQCSFKDQVWGKLEQINLKCRRTIPAMLAHWGFEVLEDWLVLAVLAANLAVVLASLPHLHGPKKISLIQLRSIKSLFLWQYTILDKRNNLQMILLEHSGQYPENLAC